MTDKTKPGIIGLSDFAGTLRGQWRLVALSMTFVTAACLALGSAVPKEYTAVAALTVSPLTTNPFSSGAVNQQINITTERAILGSNEVARIASEDLGRLNFTPSALLERTNVAAPSGSQVLEVSVTMPEPQEAADFANALAAAYLKFRSEGAAEVAAGYISNLDREIAQLSSLQNRTAQQSQRLSDAAQQRETFILVADSPGRIIGVATPPTEPSSLKPVTFLAAGLVGGLLAGTAAALLWERIDRKVRTRIRLSAACSVPALEVADGSDLEGIRWVLRSVQCARNPAGGGPLVVGTIQVTGKAEYPRDLTSRLASVARAGGLSVLVVRSTDFSVAMVDQGWPGSRRSDWAPHDLVLIESNPRLTGARRAILADCLDAALVLTFPNSTLADLRRVHSDLAASSALQIPVLLGKRFRKSMATEGLRQGLLFPLALAAEPEHLLSARKETA